MNTMEFSAQATTFVGDKLAALVTS
jgi:hypothetical protein